MSFNFNDMDQITPLIYLGNSSAASNISKLKELGIKKVLSVLDQFDWPKYDESQFNHKTLAIKDFDDQNIIKHFGECLNFIKGDDKVLVHCAAGQSRSASVVIAYIMWTKKMSFKDGLEFVNQKVFFFVYPNDGFRDQLQIFEKELIEKNYDIDKIKFEEIKWEPKNYYDYDL